MSKLVPFQPGQTWSYQWHYDWASFGDLPPEYDKIYIVKRTAKMIQYHMGDGYYKRAKIQTWPKKHNPKKGVEFFTTGRGTTRVYSNERMTLL
jgi:hypothetical protein